MKTPCNSMFSVTCSTCVLCLYMCVCVCVCVCATLTCRMARTLLDVRLCCLDFLSRSMSSRPSSSSLDSLVSMVTTSSPIIPPPEQQTNNTSGVKNQDPPLSRYTPVCSYLDYTHRQVNSTKLIQNIIRCVHVFTSVSPETGVLSCPRLSSVELPVGDFLSGLKMIVSPSVLKDLDPRGQTSSSAGRRLSVH